MKPPFYPSLWSVALAIFVALPNFSRAEGDAPNATPPPLAPRIFPHPDTIRFDSQCLIINGKDTMIFSGAFHYFRCPKELWPERFQKIKDAGLNCVETYACWNYHEQEQPSGPDDFSKVKNLQDLDDWLTMAEKYGLYVIIRPGPYICAEWEFGGFPLWLKSERPAHPLRGKVWLRTDDPVYVAWSKHWLDAVCPIIAKHQITRKSPGQSGVILFQLENEYDSWPVAKDVRINYLTDLASEATADGIDVPLFTCVTSEAREVPSGPLRNVFDCVNRYPLWDVKKAVDGAVDDLRKTQPDAPLATTELQGGWFAHVGQQLSDQQDGLSPAQIQNLTLYSWQKGETLTNYYMMFGGTNFDDWAARGLISSYDYNAPIREDGGVNERYQRVWALGHMLREHASKLVRSTLVDIDATTSDQDVQIGERKAADGSRYIFVRTDNHTDARSGHAQVKEKAGSAPEIDFDYQLEPFGSTVLYLPPGVTNAAQGEWLPKPAPPIARPTTLPAAVTITKGQTMPDPVPQKWKPITLGRPFADVGNLGSHFVYYHVPVTGGTTLDFKLQPADNIVVSAGGTLVPVLTDEKKNVTVTVPNQAKELVVLLENQGYFNFKERIESQIDGIHAISGASGPITFSSGELKGSEWGRGIALSSPDEKLDDSKWTSAEFSPAAAAATAHLLTWYRTRFELPAPTTDAWVPWHLHIEANGDGFLYLNGHGLGRYWQAGPQHDFFLPSCWLHFGAGQTNILALSLCPQDKGVNVSSLVIAPDAATAEKQ
jgi:hypothetical protein